MIAGEVLNFTHTGSVQQATLLPGRYKLEVWGAQGGYRSSSTYGGKGGYSVGELSLADKTSVFVQVGGSGANGGYNGGGTRTTHPGGGGGTDIRLRADDLYARVIAAGGGGSDGASNKAGGYGGGTAGESRTQNYGTGGGGGTQTGGGSGGNNNDGSFGVGGKGINRSSGYGGAGGGGWYGGGGAYPDGSGDDDRGGGGGSGFVWTGKNAPSGFLLTAADHLSSASTIAGNTSFPSPSGGTETGHTGDGYARITCLEIYKLTPPPPENLRQTGQSLTSISMAWNASEGAQGYKVFRNGRLLATTGQTSYTDNDLLPTQTFSYAVLAYNTDGDGDLSAAVSMSTEQAYYMVTPVIKDARFSVNPAHISAKTVLSVLVTDEMVILQPELFQAGEIYSGEA